MMKDGRLNHCKECVKSRVKKHYAETIPQQHGYETKRNATSKRKADLQTNMRNHRARNPDKYKARTAVSNALRDGRLAKVPNDGRGRAKAAPPASP